MLTFENLLSLRIGYRRPPTDPHIEVVLALIKAGADLEARNKYGETPLFWTDGHPTATLALIKAGAKVNITNTEGKTPLSEALQSNNFRGVESAKYLIAAGADVNNEAVMKALQQHFLLKGQSIQK